MAHEHNHNHSHGSPEEILALLGYMVEHNKHHAQELKEIADGLSSKSRTLILEAVEDFDRGNQKLEKALISAKGE